MCFSLNFSHSEPIVYLSYGEWVSFLAVTVGLITPSYLWCSPSVVFAAVVTSFGMDNGEAYTDDGGAVSIGVYPVSQVVSFVTTVGYLHLSSSVNSGGLVLTVSSPMFLCCVLCGSERFAVVVAQAGLVVCRQGRYPVLIAGRGPVQSSRTSVITVAMPR